MLMLLEYSEAVATLVAATGTGYVWWRSGRPRIRARLISERFTFLELENTGKRIARDVQLHFDFASRPAERKVKSASLGDMDNGQCYTYLLADSGGFLMQDDSREKMTPDVKDVKKKSGVAASEVVKNLMDTEIKVDYQNDRFFGRRVLNLRFGGNGFQRTVFQDNYTPLGRIADNTEPLTKVSIAILPTDEGNKGVAK